MNAGGVAKACKSNATPFRLYHRFRIISSLLMYGPEYYGTMSTLSKVKKRKDSILVTQVISKNDSSIIKKVTVLLHGNNDRGNLCIMKRMRQNKTHIIENRA